MEQREESPWPYYPPRTPQYDLTLPREQLPQRPPPAVTLWELATFATSRLNDDTHSPLDQQYGARFPGTNQNRAVDRPKPSQVTLLVPAVDHEMWRPRPARSSAPPVHYRPNGQLGLVWTNTETGEERVINSLWEVSQAVRNAQGLK